MTLVSLLTFVGHDLVHLDNGTFCWVHEWGWVVGTGGFHEFVAVSRARQTVDLLVASVD